MKLITTTTLCFLHSLFIFSQVHLEYGDNLMANINVFGEVDLYTFHGNEGDLIWLRMRDVSKVDAHFQLRDKTGKIIAEKFDDGGLAEMVSVLLPDTSTYTIHAFDHKHNDVGKYGISLHLLNNPAYAQTIPCYSNFSDSIRQHVAINAYQFSADSGEIIHTQMRGLTVHLEPEYHIYNEEGILLTKSKRSGRLATREFQINQTGRYTIFLSDRGGNDKDLFGFSIQTLNRRNCYPSIECGETQNQSFKNLASRQPYTLKVNKDEIGLLQLRSQMSNVEMSFSIYDEDGKLLQTKTGSDKMIDSYIQSSVNQSLLVVAFDKHGNDLGPYGLHYESVTNNICADEILCDENNEFLHTLASLAQLNTYYIHGVQDEPWAFSIKELDTPLEPYLRFFDQNGNLIFEEYSSTKLDLEGIFEMTGLYYLVVGDKSGNDTGSYKLTIHSQIPALTLPDTVFIPYDQDCLILNPESSHKIRKFSWSNGASTESLIICPDQNTQVELLAEFESGCTAIATTHLIKEVAPCGVIDFESFKLGEIPGEKLGFVSIYVHNNDGPNLATIFDSSNPPDHNTDLGTPNMDFDGPGIGKGGNKGQKGENKLHHNNLLVIAANGIDENEDGFLDKPDDDANGGFFFFEFEQNMYIETISLIDIEKNGGQVFTYDRDGKMIDKVNIQRAGDNSHQSIKINQANVAKVKIHLVGSGAIDDLVYCSSAEATSYSNQTSSQLSNNVDKISRWKSTINSDFTPLTKNQVVNNSFKIFPNPAVEHFNIVLDKNIISPAIIGIYDVVGNLVYKLKVQRPQLNPIINVDNTNFPSGIYLVRVSTAEYEVVKKLHILNK